jgi:hypothetical protein
MRNTHTPWGRADSIEKVADGIEFYSTPSHGGFRLSNERLIQLHAVHGPVKTFCGHAEWFEEDCDWAYVATAFPEHFNAEQLAHAGATLKWLQSRAPKGGQQ